MEVAGKNDPDSHISKESVFNREEANGTESITTGAGISHNFDKEQSSKYSIKTGKYKNWVNVHVVGDAEPNYDEHYDK